VDLVQEKVLLNKVEPELFDWEEQPIEYTTNDTKYLLPTGEEALCAIHNVIVPPVDPLNPDATLTPTPGTEPPTGTEVPIPQ
jgi:hypothetical protein